MAWRIHEAVVRGEIDNRVRDRVTGRIWFAGRAEPVELDLAGNCWRDLAGRRLEFVNPEPQPGELKGLATRQTGTVGDVTASRKVKVPEIPLSQIGEYYKARKPWPWHWGNSLYLEWFSDRNGRIVIESATFQLTISPDIAWDMTPDEEEKQRAANADGMSGFMQQLGEAVIAERQAKGEPIDDTPPEWNEGQPQTEEEAEKMQADSDRLADRIQARLDREGPEADYAKILEEELERRARERGEKPLTPEQEAERAEWVEEMNRAAEEALKHPDPELEAELDHKHPVAERAFELSVRMMNDVDARGWVPDDAPREHPVAELVGAAMSAGAKFAGALGGEEWPPPVDFCAGKIVRLKRAREYLDDALRAAGACAEEKLTDPAWLAAARGELESLARECDALIEDLRARLKRGFD
ncbi:MAG: hypothetical protein HZA93_28895 [Verrucomicrobia bacterium]|nr:hypothetical protein [Verrucomicrobiota bacterium]